MDGGVSHLETTEGLLMVTPLLSYYSCFVLTILCSELQSDLDVDSAFGDK